MKVTITNLQTCYMKDKA